MNTTYEDMVDVAQYLYTIIEDIATTDKRIRNASNFRNEVRRLTDKRYDVMSGKHGKIMAFCSPSAKALFEKPSNNKSKVKVVDKVPEKKENIIRKINNKNDARVCLMSSDAENRIKAVSWAGMHGEMYLVESALCDKSDEVRKIAVNWVGKKGNVGLLVNLLDDSNADVRYNAVCEIGKKGHVDLFAKLLDDSDDNVKYAALHWITIKGDVHLMVSLLTNKDASIRCELVNSIAEKDDIDAIMPMLEDSDDSVRYRAVWWVLEKGNDVQVHVLKNMKKDPSEKIRALIKRVSK